MSRDARGNYSASFSYEKPEQEQQQGKVVAFDLGIKTLATGINERGRVYHIGGFKGSQWYNRQLDKIRSKRDTCKKKSRRYMPYSRKCTSASLRRNATNEETLCTKQAISSLTNWLRELL